MIGCLQMRDSLCSVLFFFNDTATTEIYTLSLHDALPISGSSPAPGPWPRRPRAAPPAPCSRACCRARRSEEHTSELQSRQYLVCRLLLEKKTRSSVTVTHQHWLRLDSGGTAESH